MTRTRRALIAPLLIAAVVALPAPAQALDLTSGWFNWFSFHAQYVCTPRGCFYIFVTNE